MINSRTSAVECVFVVEDGRQRIIEHGTGLVEADAVLAEVGSGFATIPLKAIRHLACLMFQ